LPSISLKGPVPQGPDSERYPQLYSANLWILKKLGAGEGQLDDINKMSHRSAQLLGLIDEKKRVIVMPGHDNIDSPIIDKRTAQVLSISGDTANVMDAETYETFDLEIPGELKGQVTEGAQILYWVILSDKVMKQVKGAE